MSITNFNSNLEITGATTISGTMTNSTYAFFVLNSGNPYTSGSTLQWKDSYHSNIEIDNSTHKITFPNPGIYFFNYSINIQNTSTSGSPPLDTFRVQLHENSSTPSFINYSYVPSTTTSLNNYFMIQTTTPNEIWFMTIGGPTVSVYTNPESTLSIYRID